MTEVKEKSKKDSFKLDAEEMAQAGLHFGHRTSRINPKMNPYIFGVKNTVHIIDLQKTKEKMSEALDFIQKLASEGKIILLVGTKVQIKDLAKKTAKDCCLPYVVERWLGGIFTNFSVIFKRIEYYKDLENKKTSGELEKYTKKERAKFDQELKNLEIKFGGLKDLNRLPAAIFVCDMIKDKLAVKEAKEKGIKVIAICDTNTDPTLADFPIPANDDAISSVRYILEKTKEVILNAKSNAKSKPDKKTS